MIVNIMLAVLAASGGLAALWTAVSTGPKIRADAATSIAGAASETVETMRAVLADLRTQIDETRDDVVVLRQQVARSRAEVRKLEGQVRKLLDHIAALESDMTAAGLTPPPLPEI